MKNILYIALILIILTFGCAQKQVSIEKTTDTELNDSLNCENPQNEAEIKSCGLIGTDSKLQQCKQRSSMDFTFFCIALITEDAIICEDIEDVLYKHICKAIIKHDPLICEQLTLEQEIDMCFTDIGMNLDDRTTCNKIKDKNKKEVCLGVVDRDMEKCFEDDSYKSVCILNIIDFSDGNISCESLADEQRSQECLTILQKIGEE